MRELQTDVVIVGAGAAGLTAARALSRAGLDLVVLEARDRIGGRVLTREDPELPVAVDLGGEFIHGSTPLSFALLREAGSVAIDTAEGSFVFEDGALREGDDPFAIVAAVMRRVRGLREDVSVADFLDTLGADVGDVERARRYVRMMVEGFDAADPHLAGVRAIAEEWSDDQHGQTAQQFRPLGGYAPLLRGLRRALDPDRTQLLLATEVRVVRRHAHGVSVEAVDCGGAPLSVAARAAIVTLPVGVLRENGVRFEPALPRRTRDALDGLLMGPVVKLALRFRSAFWERPAGGRYRDGAFFQRPGAGFPTFWTLLPLRVPILIAWAGGPRAEALRDRSEAERVAIALDDLRILFGPESDPHAELEAAYTHDWQHDPYARGAYSYVAVGGGDARAALAEPVDGVLFFAGEAAVAASEAGTVAGALISGERAARDVLASLRR
jgi:monoamine oxidase